MSQTIPAYRCLLSGLKNWLVYLTCVVMGAEDQEMLLNVGSKMSSWKENVVVSMSHVLSHN